MTLLQQIQSTAQQVADAISNVLGIEVTIVDSALVRIAGTGEHRNTIGQKLTGQSLYQRVIEIKKEFVVTDVISDVKCVGCDKRPFCKELAELCCPIMLGTEVIGVIGLVAFTHERRLELLEKNERLLDFIYRMAELISAKAAETQSLQQLFFMKNQLETVLNFIAEGVLAIDNMAKIIAINYATEKMLGVKERDVVGFHINEVFPGTPIPEVLLSGTGFSNREVSIWQKGRRLHYMINAKPMIIDGIVKGVVASFRAASEWTAPPIAQAGKNVTFDSMIGSSAIMAAVKSEAKKVATTSSTVLVVGENGTGKDILAQAIHNESSRAAKPFVTVNCAAIPEHLLESELFGYAEGSFTGAKKGGKPGKFQLANGGTLFLDEIGDMPLSLQAKILRVLQAKVVEPVGSLKSFPVDVRIIAATNRNLEDLIKRGLFREDLYYRLNVFPLILPPLRERSGDITELASHFLLKHAPIHGKEFKSLSPETRKALQTYHWPGNVRELENIIECAVIKTAGDTIPQDDLPINILTKMQTTKPALSLVDSPEKRSIINALQLFGTSVEGKKKAADHLGVGIATLYRKLKKYNI